MTGTSLIAAFTASLVFTTACHLVATRAAHALPRRAPPAVASARTFEAERTGREDETITRRPADPPAVPRRTPVLVAIPPPSPDVEQALRARLAYQIDSLPLCRRFEGAEGRATAEVTFSPDGTARVALPAALARTPAGACVARRLAGAAQPFSGNGTVTIRASFEL